MSTRELHVYLDGNLVPGGQQHGRVAGPEPL